MTTTTRKTTSAALVRTASFFCVCQQGMEGQLRKELVELGCAPGFQTEGFLTAKAPHPIGVDRLPRPVLARRVCLSLGKDDDVIDVADVDVEHGEAEGAAAAEGDVVKTKIQRGASAFFGLHVQRRGMSPDPCGDPRLVVPETAPSRAWLKLEEAARIWPLPLDAGDIVLEVGCAPGGVSRALLDRGCRVVGVDPNAMDPRVLADRNFRHWHMPAQRVNPRELPGPIRMVILDVNQRANAALSSIEHLVTETKQELRACLFTLKLGSWEHVRELPHWQQRIERMTGMRTQATQLPSNRQELCVFATAG